MAVQGRRRRRANGGKRWLNLHVIDLQPSEMFKLFTVLFIAWLVQHHHNELDTGASWRCGPLPVSFGCALIVIEPDIGTTSVVVVIAFVDAGGRRTLAAMLVGSPSLCSRPSGTYMSPSPTPRAVLFVPPPEHAPARRAGTSCSRPASVSAPVAISGLGLGHSREKWGLLPNPHTDFIFTIIGEELGAHRHLAVIALFVAFLFAAVRIAQQCTNSVYRLIAVGITTWIAVEALINIASVVGWWAVTGIPLPFFSYGGTALITELAASGCSTTSRTTAPTRRRDDSREHGADRLTHVRARPSSAKRAPRARTSKSRAAAAFRGQNEPRHTGPCVMGGPIVITGGGTGGHIFPMEAIADPCALAASPPDDLRFVGSRRGQERRFSRGDVALTLFPGGAFVDRCARRPPG